MTAFIPNPTVVRQILSDDEFNRSIAEVAAEGERFAKEHVEVDTGELQDSIHVEDGETPGSKRVVAGTDHWQFVEFEPNHAPFLRPMIPALGLKSQ